MNKFINNIMIEENEDIFRIGEDSTPYAEHAISLAGDRVPASMLQLQVVTRKKECFLTRSRTLFPLSSSIAKIEAMSE